MLMSYHKLAKTSPKEVDTLYCVIVKITDHHVLVAVGEVRRKSVETVDRGILL